MQLRLMQLRLMQLRLMRLRLMRLRLMRLPRLRKHPRRSDRLRVPREIGREGTPLVAGLPFLFFAAAG
jgi:hypothetical protein